MPKGKDVLGRHGELFPSITLSKLGRPRRRWKYNISMELREIWGEGAGWMHLAQDKHQWWAVVNKVMNIWVQ